MHMNKCMQQFEETSVQRLIFYMKAHKKVGAHERLQGVYYCLNVYVLCVCICGLFAFLLKIQQQTKQHANHIYTPLSPLSDAVLHTK